MATFYDCFKENMQALGLPAAESVFGTRGAALGTASTLNGLVDKFATRVTLRELVHAGLRAERLMVVGGVSAAFHAGAVIGSSAVAAGRSLSGGTSSADVLALAAGHGLGRPWLTPVLARQRGICAAAASARAAAAQTARP